MVSGLQGAWSILWSQPLCTEWFGSPVVPNNLWLESLVEKLMGISTPLFTTGWWPLGQESKSYSSTRLVPGYFLKVLLSIPGQSSYHDVRVHRAQGLLALHLSCRETGDMDSVSALK
jgi:hypothetical protein